MPRMQTAMEYLITYGWAIGVIAIVLAAIASIGVFSLGSFAKNECIINGGFGCENFFIAGNGLLTINIFQSTQDPVNVTYIGCDQNGTPANMQQPYNPPSNQEYMPVGSNYTFTVLCYTDRGSLFAADPGQVFSGYIVINYTDEVTGSSGSVSGKVVSKVI